MPGLLSKLLPREQSFFDMFVEMAENIHDGAQGLADLLANYTDVPAKVDRIKEIEHRGDDITHNLITRLNQTFITPFDREDIHELSSKIDDVLDLTDAAASLMVTYHVDRVRPGVPELAKILLAATTQVAEAVRALGKHDRILDHCIEINRLENESDRLCRSLMAELFEGEKDPVQIIKWKEIIEVIETAVDKCEDVANVLEAVTLKSA
jgi:predicted phosphate transport protein (TIGR00153 family)